MAAARKSTFFFVRFRNVPMMDVGMMTKTDVPFAMAAGKCNNIIIAGTMGESITTAAGTVAGDIETQASANAEE